VLDASGKVPQRAVYGRVLAQHVPGCAPDVTLPKLYVNSNAPFSALVCGVQVRSLFLIIFLSWITAHSRMYARIQGSGKSHSTSVLLESCLIRDKRIGTLPAPLSGLV
jgi:hypothetical protein